MQRLNIIIQRTVIWIQAWRPGSSGPAPLGRWSIDKCHTKTDLTNYYNNIDHCGTCLYQRSEAKEIIKTHKEEKEKEETII